METFGTLMDRGGKILDLGDTVRKTDWQVYGHLDNRAVRPPADLWIGFKIAPFPHPTFIRLDE